LERAVTNPEDIRSFAPGEFSGPFSTRRWVLILPGAPLESIERDLWYNAFQPLINHRSNQGLDVEVKYVGEITTASGEAAVDDIREYLQDQHSNHNAQWVCLAGDDEMIPWSYRNITASAPYFDPNSRIPNDWCYCDLDGVWIEYQPGMDWAPEMWAGRIPCLTPTEGSCFVDKVLAYEQNPGGGDYSYLNRALYESADQMTDGATCEQVMTHQHPSLEDTLFAEQPSGSDPNPTAPWAWQVRDKINSVGYNYFVVHCHGSKYNYATMSYLYSPAKDLFGASEIDSLTNEDQYFFLYSMACLNAHIDNTVYRTFVEKITCMFEHRGAIAFAGYTRYGAAGDCPSSTNLNCHAWDQLFPDLFFPWCFNHVGAVEARSKTQGYLTPDVGNEHMFGHNLFGDPATPIWTPDYTPTMNKPLSADPATEVIILSDIRLYPSPTGANCTISFLLHQRSPVDIDLYDVTGRTVWTCRIPTFQSGNVSQSLDFTDISSGTYILLLKTTGTSVSDRIVICR